MAGVYLASVALLTAAALVVVARSGPVPGRWPRRLAALAALWLAIVGVTWAGTRLTLDLAFLFGSQGAILVAAGLWLASGVRRGRAAGAVDGSHDTRGREA